MKFSLQKKTGLAVDALRALNGVDGLTATAELAATIGTTQPFLPQIMSPLVKAGWVESKRGPSGGYRLVADPDAISALDLIEAVEGPTDTGTCVLKGGPCGGETHCSMHVPWRAARTALLDELAAIPVLTVTSPI
ncbi:MAG: Rrf2 family transcriptional regulator [Acidimicrobiia bacterium]|nr:Rrf2 family transcriptional regulator [Acidimicrobiia bacterium]